MNKNILLAGLFSSVFMLGACGANSEEGEANSSKGSGEDKTPIEITWRGTGEADNIRRYLESFEADFEAENNDIDIVLAPIMASEGDYFSKVALAMQSPDTAPDIVSEDTFMLNSDANAGYLASLDEQVENWDEWDMFIDNIKTGTTGEDGSVYGIPTTTDSRGIWYNKEVFKEAGLSEDWQPESWEDVYSAGEAIKSSGSEAIPFSMNVAKANGEAVSMQTFEMLLYGTGETLYDSETKKWNVNGEGIVDSLTFVDEIMNQQKLGPSLSIALNSSYGSVMTQDLLPNGGVGMVLDGNWNIGNYLEGGAVPLDNIDEVLGFATFPTQNGEDPGFVTMAGGWSWAIPSKAQNQDASWKVIEAMSSKESQSDRAVLEGTLTVREDSSEDSRYMERPLIEKATMALENAQFRPKSDLYPNVSIEIQNAVEAVASGVMTPKEAADSYKKAVTEIVGEENTY